MKFSHKWFAFILMFALVSCVSLTVNVNFPVSEVRQAAEEIEERVRTGQGTEGLQSLNWNTPAGPERYRVALSFGGREAQAQEKVDIKIETPSLKQIIASRTKRYKEIEPFMSSGVLGEGMNSFLAVRDSAGQDLKQMTQIKKLVKEENDDRMTLYKEILVANKLEASEENMKRVQEQFVQAIRKKIKKGHWYQVKKDEWVQQQKDPEEK